MKCLPVIINAVSLRRSPHGERGLKFIGITSVSARLKSLPPRGAWIEIAIFDNIDQIIEVAPPTGSVD